MTVGGMGFIPERLLMMMMMICDMIHPGHPIVPGGLDGSLGGAERVGGGWCWRDCR